MLLRLSPVSGLWRSVRRSDTNTGRCTSSWFLDAAQAQETGLFDTTMLVLPGCLRVRSMMLEGQHGRNQQERGSKERPPARNKENAMPATASSTPPTMGTNAASTEPISPIRMTSNP